MRPPPGVADPGTSGAARTVAARGGLVITGRRGRAVDFSDRTSTFTVISDLTTSEPCVLYVAAGRDRGSLDGSSRRSASLGDSRSRKSRGWQERHTDGVIDVMVTNITNARSEATNAKIQMDQAAGLRVP